MPNIKERQMPGDQSRDMATVDLLTYNEKSGARKALNLGPNYLPLSNGSGGFTTDASTKRILPAAGQQLYVYNSGTVVYAVTVGDSTMTAQAPGVVQTSGNPTAPFVGIPCPPGIWTWIGMGQWNQVMTNNAALMVFLVDDPTFLFTLPATNAPDLLPPFASSGV